jgi:DNA-binding transcriptional regulator PaaX
MGIQEREHRKRLRRNQLQELILGTIAVTGMLSVALVAPQVLIAMKKLGLTPSVRQGTVIGTSIARLLKNDLLSREGGRLRLTDKGQHVLLRASLEPQFHKKQRWDGKWRVLIFDIPEYRKGLRQKVRNTLRTVGFRRLQDSVWAFPYDCEDFIVLLKADFRVGRDLLYMIVDSLEGDTVLLQHFKLKR